VSRVRIVFIGYKKKKKGAFTMQECFKEKKNPTLIEQKKKKSII
jgi:hypothetical protein